jgi:hypothetical protein
VQAAVRVARRQITKGSKMIEAYRLTDNLSDEPYCKVRREVAASWVEQNLARWCKDGKAIQQTEAIADPCGTRSALSRADRAITSADSMANAGAEESDDRIAAARRKVQAWPSVGAGKLTRAPLPTEPGGIRQISREELERLSLDSGSAFVGSGIPVDYIARMNRRITIRLLDNDLVQQRYEDLASADELNGRESLSDEPENHGVDETELAT